MCPQSPRAGGSGDLMGDVFPGGRAQDGALPPAGSCRCFQSSNGQRQGGYTPSDRLRLSPKAVDPILVISSKIAVVVCGEIELVKKQAQRCVVSRVCDSTTLLRRVLPRSKRAQPLQRSTNSPPIFDHNISSFHLGCRSERPPRSQQMRARGRCVPSTRKRRQPARSGHRGRVQGQDSSAGEWLH